jgi:L-cysteine/cystine lyase
VGLVSFQLFRPDGSPIAPQGVVARLGEQGLWLRQLNGPSCLRACTHVTTTDGEVDQLLEALHRLVVDQ